MNRKRMWLKVVISLCLLLAMASSSEVSYEDLTYDLMTYQDAPAYVQERIADIREMIEADEITGSQTMQMDGADGTFALILLHYYYVVS